MLYKIIKPSTEKMHVDQNFEGYMVVGVEKGNEMIRRSMI